MSEEISLSLGPIVTSSKSGGTVVKFRVSAHGTRIFGMHSLGSSEQELPTTLAL
jgi:hypothetical protein